MKDVTILYQGGSGGFALYYYLLLSGKYQYNIETVQSMITQQFPAELSINPYTWKDTEFWPNNLELKKANGSKLFLICNPLFNPDVYETNQSISSNTYKILLYTNIHLQVRMAYEKQAYWFTAVSRRHFNAPNDTKQYLKQILSGSKSYYDKDVDPELLNLITKFSPDQITQLEDFVNSTVLVNFPSTNRYQLDFLDYWKSLQSIKATQLLSKKVY